MAAGFCRQWRQPEPEHGTTPGTIIQGDRAGNVPLGRLIVEPDDGRKEVLKVLDNAKKSITLTIYEIDDPEINAALIKAVARGVKVRILHYYYSFHGPRI